VPVPSWPTQFLKHATTAQHTPVSRFYIKPLTFNKLARMFDSEIFTTLSISKVPMNNQVRVEKRDTTDKKKPLNERLFCIWTT